MRAASDLRSNGPWNFTQALCLGECLTAMRPFQHQRLFRPGGCAGPGCCSRSEAFILHPGLARLLSRQLEPRTIANRFGSPYNGSYLRPNGP